MRQRGSANSTMAFVRSLGMTVGITIFGIIQRNDFASRMADSFGGGGGAAVPSGDNARQMLAPETRAQIPQDVMDKIVGMLSSSISVTFMWSIIPAVLALVSVLFMGKASMKDLIGHPVKTESSATEVAGH